MPAERSNGPTGPNQLSREGTQVGVMQDEAVVVFEGDEIKTLEEWSNPRLEIKLADYRHFLLRVDPKSPTDSPKLVAATRDVRRDTLVAAYLEHEAGLGHSVDPLYLETISGPATLAEAQRRADRAAASDRRERTS